MEKKNSMKNLCSTQKPEVTLTPLPPAYESSHNIGWNSWPDGSCKKSTAIFNEL